MNKTIFIGIIVAFTFSGCTIGLISLMPRPQEPKQSERNYVIKEVTFEGGDKNIKIAGELTCPKGEGPFPAMVLVTGQIDAKKDLMTGIIIWGRMYNIRLIFFSTSC
jgi:hypothetical protein